ncbi:hotdog fold thioesterase [Falsiroseomonas tokyonensis]|uniref:Hotdog fold thioesterase n=1 Tax=Falsiroseomonas tokyonensis TaxID=430521 RepID=A0ABV7BVS6_9PROT|nr:hotdog fold thioesterase [Falsiroseomonas tokyonensis]MBU8539082.1 hotdog fold thioesterase [Falsiroseomonas tokyonensis]
MTLWKRDWTPAQINARMADNMAGMLGIEVTEIGSDALHATMPVDARHAQPFGLLHGGASVVLSETLGSLACMMTLEEGKRAVGIEVNANHMAGVKRGETVTAICRPMHTGARTQVWQTEIRRADGKLACVSRLTCAVVGA